MRRQLLMGIGVVISLASWTAAGVEAQAAAQDAKGAKTTTLTGCLAKGTDATSFMLNDAMPAAAAKEQSSEATKSTAMRSYHVMVAKDATMKLTDHVGHKVTLTGTVDETAAKGGAAGTTGGAAGAGKAAAMTHLTVTAMKHVAATCTP